MLLLGQSLAGAGGGGFLCIIMKNPNYIERIKDEIQKLEVSHWWQKMFQFNSKELLESSLSIRGL